MGMAVYGTQRRASPEAMFYRSGEAVAEQVSDASLATGLIYRRRARFFSSLAARPIGVAEYIFEKAALPARGTTSERHCGSHSGPLCIVLSILREAHRRPGDGVAVGRRCAALLFRTDSLLPSGPSMMHAGSRSRWAFGADVFFVGAS